MCVKKWFVLLVTLYSSQLAAFAYVKNNLTCDIENGKPLLNHGGLGFGPYNYSEPKDQQKFNTVINNHFSKNVQRLVSGQTTSIAGDLDFTLRALPNYPPALDSMSRYYYKLKKVDKVNLSQFAQQKNYYTSDCYFKRALYYDNNNPSVNLLYAIDLHRNKKYEAAEDLYFRAERLHPNNPEISYNIGLLFAEQNKWDKAEEYANKAYTAGFPLLGLKNKIESYKNSQSVEKAGN